MTCSVQPHIIFLSNISFTELKKQNQMLMKDIGQLKSDSKENSGKHNDDLDKVKTQLETTEVGENHKYEISVPFLCASSKQ